MRLIKMSHIEKNILKNSKEVNAKIKTKQKSQPRIRRNRPRSIDERIALTKITKATIERAKREGKMKMIGPRRMYYDPSE